MDIYEFCKAVGKTVEQQYQLSDGDNLAYTLVERGELSVTSSISSAAQLVAQHLEQQ